MCSTVTFHRWDGRHLCRLNIYWYFGAASELRVGFCTSKTGLPPHPPTPPPPPPSPNPTPVVFLLTDHFKVVPQLQFFIVPLFILDICFVIICSSSFLLLVPWEACASWFWHFLGIVTYFWGILTCIWTSNISTSYMTISTYTQITAIFRMENISTVINCGAIETIFITWKN